MSPLASKKAAMLKHQDIIALVCFFAVAVFFIWKARHSSGYEDESYYYTISQRLFLGDSFLTDEWHLAQWFNLFLYLPYKAYVLFAGSADGIILFFRYMFVAFQSTVSVAIYLMIRKYGMFSILAVLIFFLHIPLTFMAMSHNTLGLAFVEITGLLFLSTMKPGKIRCFVIGLLMAGAVLCNPSLIFLFFFYSVCMIVYEATKNKKHRGLDFSGTVFSFKSWLWITLGISALAAVFLAFLFSRASLKEIMDNLPMLFTDPVYNLVSKENGSQNVITIHKSLLTLILFSPLLFSAYVVLMAAIAFDKRRINHRLLYLAAAFVIYLTYTVQIVLSPVLPGLGIYFWMYPLALLGFTCYSLSEHKDKRAFMFLWLMGVLYGICLDISSDFAPWSSSFGLTVSDMASVLFIKNIIDELKNNGTCQNKIKNYTKKNEQNKRAIASVVAAILATSLFFQIGLEAYIDADINRYSVEYGYNTYWPSTEKLTAAIETGPLKGIKTTARTVRLYNGMLNDLDIIINDSKKNNNEGTVLVTGYYPWCYLYLDMPYATYSADIYQYIGNIRLAEYYKLHPNKVPDYIYIPKAARINIGDIPEWANNAVVTENPTDILAAVIKQYRCTVQESDTGYMVMITPEYEPG